MQTCRRCVSALELIARNKVDMHLTLQNKQAMALTHGFAHGLVQSVLFHIRYAFVCTNLVAPLCVCQILIVLTDAVAVSMYMLKSSTRHSFCTCMSR